MPFGIDILPARHEKRLAALPEGRYAREGLLESLKPRNLPSTLWRNKYRLLGAATVLSLGHSAGLWARLAPWAGRLGETVGGWMGFGEAGKKAGTAALGGVDTMGEYSGKGFNYFWNHLKNGANAVGLGGAAETAEGAHKTVTEGARKHVVDRIPVPIPRPEAPPVP